MAASRHHNQVRNPRARPPAVPRSPWRLSWFGAAALTLPLLSVGTCSRIAQTSIVEGFFTAVTPMLVAEFEDYLADRLAPPADPDAAPS